MVSERGLRCTALRNKTLASRLRAMLERMASQNIPLGAEEGRKKGVIVRNQSPVPRHKNATAVRGDRVRVKTLRCASKIAQAIAAAKERRAPIMRWGGETFGWLVEAGSEVCKGGCKSMDEPLCFWGRECLRGGAGRVSLLDDEVYKSAGNYDLTDNVFALNVTL